MTASGRCRDCTHWERSLDEEKSYGGNKGNCACQKFLYVVDISRNEEGVRSAPNDALIYWDHEGYSAGFITGADFGCIHFIERSP
jgi:hypothetical protein